MEVERYLTSGSLHRTRPDKGPHMLPVITVKLSFIFPLLKTREDLDQIFQKPRLDESYQDWVTSLDKLERIQESQYW